MVLSVVNFLTFRQTYANVRIDKVMHSLVFNVKCVCICVCATLAATAMVSIEVFRAMVYKMNEWVKGYNWFLGKFQYGFSCAFAWVTFILLVLSGLAFLATSRKRKREKALSEREARENEPVHLGR